MELTPEKLKALEERLGWSADRIVAVNKRVEEKQLTLTPAEIEAIERQVDESFLRYTGRTYREPRIADLPHAEKNGDASQHPADSWQKRVMRCGGWGGWCVSEDVDTEEGALRLVRCVNCGARFESLVNQHRRQRPEPYRYSSTPVYQPRR